MSKLIEDYKLTEVIGVGQYGKVYLATNMKDNQQYAVKVISRTTFEEVPKLREFVVNEIQTLLKISNKHIVKFIEMLKTQNNAYFVYEFCNGGNLEKLIFERGPLKEEIAFSFFKQVVKGFKSIVSRNIIHRDLKLQNILLHNDVVKVADFGFCKPLVSKNEMVKTILGSPIYMAPEILRGMKYNMKADIWSLGILLYEMLYGLCPYEGNSIPQIVNLIETTPLNFPPEYGISNSTKNIIASMLIIDPYQRIDWDDIFKIVLGDENSLDILEDEIEVKDNFNLNFEETQTNRISSKVEAEKIEPLDTGKLLEPLISTVSTILNDKRESRAFSLKELSFYSSISLKDEEKREILLALLQSRNKIYFGVNVINNILSYDMNQFAEDCARKISLLVHNSAKKFNEDISSPQKSELFKCVSKKAELIESFEFKKFQQTVSQESELTLELFNLMNEKSSFLSLISENTFPSNENYKKSLFQYIQTILENTKPLNAHVDRDIITRNLVHINEILDLILLDQIFSTFVDRKISFEEQNYFHALKRLETQQISEILEVKLNYVRSKLI